MNDLSQKRNYNTKKLHLLVLVAASMGMCSAAGDVADDPVPSKPWHRTRQGQIGIVFIAVVLLLLIIGLLAIELNKKKPTTVDAICSLNDLKVNNKPAIDNCIMKIAALDSSLALEVQGIVDYLMITNDSYVIGNIILYTHPGEANAAPKIFADAMTGNIALYSNPGEANTNSKICVESMTSQNSPHLFILTLNGKTKAEALALIDVINNRLLLNYKEKLIDAINSVSTVAVIAYDAWISLVGDKLNIEKASLYDVIESLQDANIDHAYNIVRLSHVLNSPLEDRNNINGFTSCYDYKYRLLRSIANIKESLKQAEVNVPKFGCNIVGYAIYGKNKTTIEPNHLAMILDINMQNKLQYQIIKDLDGKNKADAINALLVAGSGRVIGKNKTTINTVADQMFKSALEGLTKEAPEVALLGTADRPNMGIIMKLSSPIDLATSKVEVFINMNFIKELFTFCNGKKISVVLLEIQKWYVASFNPYDCREYLYDAVQKLLLKDVSSVKVLEDKITLTRKTPSNPIYEYTVDIAGINNIGHIPVSTFIKCKTIR